MSTPVLELTGVAKSYPGTPPIHALRGVDVARENFGAAGVEGAGHRCGAGPVHAVIIHR